MRVTDKGQITIPIEIRQRLGLHPGAVVEVSVEGDVVCVRKAAGPSGRGALLIARMRGAGDVGLTTDEIMAMTRGE